MPLYTYKCTCEERFTKFSTIANYQREMECPKCGQLAERFIDAAPMVKGDYPGYSCPITGDWIEGRRAHEENLKKHGCRVFEPGETEEFKRRRAAEDLAFEESVAATAEAEVAAMTSRQKEQLGAEMDAGLTAEVVRK